MLATWLVLGLWLLVIAAWCTYQLGYRRGLRRARALYEPALDQLAARLAPVEQRRAAVAATEAADDGEEPPPRRRSTDWRGS